MADASFVHSNFSGGEVSKSMQGRLDRPDYRTFLNVCLNSLPIEQGAWQRRSGTHHGGFTRGGVAGRVISFDFKQAAPYLVEFTNGHLRFWSGTNLATTDDTQVIIDISAANPAVAHLVGAPPWVTGDQAIIRRLDATGPLLQNRVFALTRIDGTHFSLADAVTGATIDGSTLGAISGGATMARVMDIATSPYTVGAWASTRLVQSDIPIANGTTPGAFLLNATIAPWLLQVVSPPNPPIFATFSLNPAAFIDGPYLDSVTTGETITLSGPSGSVTITASGSGFGGFKATDVGRLIRFFIEPPAFDSGLSYSGGNVVASPPSTLTTAAVYWRCVAAAPTSATPGTDLKLWVLWPETKDVAVWSWATITGFTSATQVTATINYGIPIYGPTGAIGTPPTLPIVLWRMGVYSNTTGWPTCGTFHEGRLWLSGVIANRIDGSVSNDPLNFAPTNLLGQVADNNAIAYRFTAPDVNPILWMEPDGQGIVCGTQAGEWLVQATAANAILSPTSIQAHRVTKNGCANIEPRRTEHTLVAVQRYGREILEYFADVFSGKFSAQNIIDKGKHLTKTFIREIAYQQELCSIVWARMGDGSLAGVTYKRDSLMSSQPAALAGAHRHTLGSGRVIESITVGPSVDGNLDSLAMVTNDTPTDLRHVEVMATLWEEGNALSSAWLLDNAVQPSSTTTTSTGSAGAPYGSMTLNGLWHLNGKTVQVFAGGIDCGNRGDNLTVFTDFVVTNGSITVPYGDGVSAGTGAGQFTPAFAAACAAAGTIVVGFTYTSDGQIVPANAPAESGARNGPAFGKIQRIQRYAIKVYDSAGMSIGTDFSKMLPILFKDAIGTALAPGAVFSGTYREDLKDDYGLSNMICWRVTRPYPANIATLGGFLHTQDV